MLFRSGYPIVGRLEIKKIKVVVHIFQKNTDLNKFEDIGWNGTYLFQATSPGKVPGSSALYQKWVNPQGETLNMLKTTFAPDGSIIHVKPK